MRTLCCTVVLAVAVAAPALAQGDPEKGFVPLFTGSDLDGWEEADGFVVDDGTILTKGAKAGDLYTEAEYGNYVLRFGYMLSPVGNSGVFVRAETEDPLDRGFEVQLLAPWSPYRDDLHCTGSLYGHVPVVSRPDESTEVWHTMEIVLDRDTVIVSVDGTITTWARTGRVETLADKSPRGRIGLQGNHSDPDQWVRFRNLRIRDLDTDVGYVLRGLGRTDPAIRRSAHAAAVGHGAAAVAGLVELMAGGDPASSSLAREALFAIVARASGPDGSPGSREALRGKLDAAAADVESAETKGYVTWLGGLLERE